MVYGNYDPAYIEPVCDLCGEKVQKRYEYIPFEIQTAVEMRGAKTDIHEGHLCNGCNELEEHDIFAKANKIEFHFKGTDPSRLLMVDVFWPQKTGGQLKSYQKLGPDETPEFMRQLACGIVHCKTGVRSTEYDCDRTEEITKMHKEAAREARGGRPY